MGDLRNARAGLVVQVPRRYWCATVSKKASNYVGLIQFGVRPDLVPPSCTDYCFEIVTKWCWETG